MTACASADVESQAASAPIDDIQCSGTDPSPGLDLPVGWVDGEQRELLLSETSRGAGIPPRLDGVIATTRVTVTAIEDDGQELTLRWTTAGTDFDDAAIDPAEESMPAMDMDFRIDSSGTLRQIGDLEDLLAEAREVYGALDDEALLELLGGDLEIYQLPELSIGEGETATEPTSMINPMMASLVDATRTTEHLGTDESGCEVIRVTRHTGPDAIIDDLDNLLEQLGNPDERPNAFDDVGFNGAVVRTATYRYDHGIDRVRQVEFTEAWAVLAAGGVDTRVESKVFTDISDQ